MILVEFFYYSSFFPESQEPAALPKFRDPEPDPPRKGVLGYGTAPLLTSALLPPDPMHGAAVSSATG